MLGIFPIEISVTLLKKIQKNLLFINPGQSHELDEIQKRQLIFNLREMSNPLNFGNCVVAFLEHRRSIWIVSSGGFYEKILGVSRSRRLRLTTEAALEEIEGGRGRGWGCALCAWQMRSFLSMMATKAAWLVVSSKSARNIFWASWGGGFPYDVMLAAWESSFLLLSSTTK